VITLREIYKKMELCGLGSGIPKGTEPRRVRLSGDFPFRAMRQTGTEFMFRLQRKRNGLSLVSIGFANRTLPGSLGLCLLMIAGILACGDAPVFSQQTGQKTSPPPGQPAGQQGPPITSEVRMVKMLASVRDKKGHLVNNLSKDDFTVEQDGHAETITYFAQEANLPLTLGLLVDTSMSQRGVLDQERSASHTFIEQVLRDDKDKAFVIHFDYQVELLQDITSSRPKLEASLEQLGAPQFSQTRSSDPDDNGGHGSYGHHGGGTLLYDAVYLASNELMKKQQGRKALIVLTDGVDRGSKESLQEAIETAQRADTLVYSILFADKEGYGHDGGYGGPHMGHGGMGGGGMGGGGMGGGRHRYPEESRPDGKKVLQQLSAETGGRFFEVTKKQPIDAIYDDISEELRNQYGIGYVPDKADAAPGYHKIHLTVKQKDLIVQTREGYYADR
jgi:VWFA-related protein